MFRLQTVPRKVDIFVSIACHTSPLKLVRHAHHFMRLLRSLADNRRWRGNKGTQDLGPPSLKALQR